MLRYMQIILAYMDAISKMEICEILPVTFAKLCKIVYNKSVSNFGCGFSMQ